MSYTCTKSNSSFTADGSDCSGARSFASLLLLAGIVLTMSVLFCVSALSLRLCLIAIITIIILSVLLIAPLSRHRKR